MRIIEAFKISDGTLFTDRDAAIAHLTDTVGEMLDGLIPDDDRGNVTRADRYNILTKMLSDLPALRKKIEPISQALEDLTDFDN